MIQSTLLATGLVIRVSSVYQNTQCPGSMRLIQNGEHYSRAAKKGLSETFQGYRGRFALDPTNPLENKPVVKNIFLNFFEIFLLHIYIFFPQNFFIT